MGVAMKSTVSYRQHSKNYVRHSSISWAVETLTTKREQSCCVERNYVRKVHDYFVMNEDDSTNKKEAMKLSVDYISAWEKLHDSCVGTKRTDELVVCYLAGPEPDNDFSELVSLGILPQNIWAFESDKSIYQKAISAYPDGQFFQPKIIKQNIEVFFEMTPKKFDIVYIDACGSIPSSKHALKCVTSICRHHRLNSPGVIITNFAGFENQAMEMVDYCHLISQYLFFKEQYSPNHSKTLDWRFSNEYEEFYKTVKENIDFYYGDFISAILRDIPCVLVPLQRITKNPYLQQILNGNMNKTIQVDKLLEYDNTASLANYFFAMKTLQEKGELDEKTRILFNELGSIDDILCGLEMVVLLKNNKTGLDDDIKTLKDFFDKGNYLYQFLDKPHSNLFFDVIINQLTYPLHYNLPASRSFSYKAKATQMYTDVTVYDECRYIYEWLPGLHQMKSAFKNLSWQYVFRFALDGLVKMRQKYNNEFFYQGSVISNKVDGFENKAAKSREKI